MNYVYIYCFIAAGVTVFGRKRIREMSTDRLIEKLKKEWKTSGHLENGINQTYEKFSEHLPNDDKLFIENYSNKIHQIIIKENELESLEKKMEAESARLKVSWEDFRKTLGEQITNRIKAD